MKECPACGQKVPQDAQMCPSCGLEGLDQLFLSQESYEYWVKTVLTPHMDTIQPPQVFAGDGFFLILLKNGDLYVMGDNRSRACGTGLPQEIKKPARIARQVKHAAAGKHHSAYITEEGQVVLLGESSLTERFSSDLSGERIYAVNERDAFVVVDQKGDTYFFGFNDGSALDRKTEVLRELPEMTESWRSGLVSREYDSDEVGTCGLYYTTMETERTHGIYWKLDAVKRQEWYRDYLQRYGSCNVELKQGVWCEKRITYFSPGDPYDETEWEEVYRPKVVLSNDLVFQPVPCSPLEEIRYSCGWLPQTSQSCWKEIRREKFFQPTGTPLVQLTKEGTMRIVQEEPITLDGVLDAALYTHSVSQRPPARILLVTRRREVILTDFDSVKRGEQKPAEKLIFHGNTEIGETVLYKWPELPGTGGR